MELVDALDQTFQHAHGVIANVHKDQYGDPTPCTEWTVEALLGHMVGVVTMMGTAAGGGPIEGWRDFELSSDPAGQFADASAAALAAWRAPGVMERIIQIPAGEMPGQAAASINLADTLTHSWDLARATGQPTELPEGPYTAALEICRSFISPELRTGRFGPEVPAPAGADVTTQLVAFLGRNP